jgi:hypothetical protein
MPLATPCWQYVGIPVLQGREEVNLRGQAVAWLPDPVRDALVKHVRRPPVEGSGDRRPVHSAGGYTAIQQPGSSASGRAAP